MKSLYSLLIALLVLTGTMQHLTAHALGNLLGKGYGDHKGLWWAICLRNVTMP